MKSTEASYSVFPSNQTIGSFLKGKSKRKSSVYKSAVLQCCISIQKYEHKEYLRDSYLILWWRCKFDPVLQD
jgi:hypothetical protein